jgi:phosphatidylglycerophosphate synthase
LEWYGYTIIMDDSLDRFSLKRLRITTAIILLIWMAAVLSAAYLFLSIARQAYVLIWISVSIPSGLIFIVLLWIALPGNRSTEYSMLHPRFELPNLLSILRGLLLSCLVGFIFIPYKKTNLELIPGIVFIGTILLDAVDGAVARMSNCTSFLGETLDTNLDYASLTIGSLIMAAQSINSVLFILTAALGLILPAGKWFLRKRKEQPENNPYIKKIINLDLGFIGIALLPEYSSSVVSTASFIFLLPLLAATLHDLLIDSGMLSRKMRIRKPDRLWYDLFLLALRVAAAGMLMFSPAYPIEFSSFLTGLFFSMAVFSGFLPKVGMVGFLLIGGDLLSHSASDGMLWTAFILAGLSLILSAGIIAVWSPEDGWLEHGFKGGNASD